MATPLFDRETWLDLVVNIVPIAIMFVMIALFVVFNPWGGSALGRAYQYILVAVWIVVLAVVTYFGARAIEGET